MAAKKAKYVGNCTTLPGEHVEKMVDQAKPIEYEYFLRVVSREDLKQLFPRYRWHRGWDTGLRLKDDWAVRFYSSTFKGKPCVFIDHSAIEYVFVCTN